jgi:two-component system, chemotaxis family, sensor histidine kinase and response regulator PixL
MSQAQEREIQLQFLEEAQEYLSTIEANLIGIAQGDVQAQQVDAILRAAHSIKGGAGMMGFQILSDVAHQLEDFFKILKAQRPRLNVEIEQLFLRASDHIRHIITLSQHGQSIESSWLQQQVAPIWAELQTRLGDYDEANDTLLLSSPGSNANENIAGLLFETEVEGCLQRLEAVLADPKHPCLREEMITAAQELAGLGEILELATFSRLCVAITQQLETAPPAQVELMSQAALQTLRHAQALVMVGQIELLPQDIGTETYLTNAASAPELLAVSFADELPEPLSSTDAADKEEVAPWDRVDADNLPDIAIAASQPTDFLDPLDRYFGDTDIASIANESIVNVPADDRSEDEWDKLSLDETGLWKLFEDENDENIVTIASTSAPEQLLIESFTLPKPTQLAESVEQFADPQSTPALAVEDSNVRISAKRLNQLNDWCSQLLIERSALNTHLGRLRNWVNVLNQRVNTLERVNQDLRTAYDQVATNSTQTTPFYTPSLHQPASYVSDLDRLEMDQYGELHQRSLEVMERIVQIQEVSGDIELSLNDAEQTANSLTRTSKHLQQNLTQVRLRPLSDVVDRFPRALRDLCFQHGKSVLLDIQGGGTLLERSILDGLSEPLMHLLRNAFDHGIEDAAIRRAQGKPEQGMIRIRAFSRGNQTVIMLSDDGSGINLDQVRAKGAALGLDPALLASASQQELLDLLFEPGFSTAEQVTTLSGRGIGLDVVRSNLNRLRGKIKIETTPGQGTTFILSVPFTLSVNRILLVECQGMPIALPIDDIEELILLDSIQTVQLGSETTIHHAGRQISIVDLRQWLQFNCPRQTLASETQPTINVPSLILVNPEEQWWGLPIDRSWGEQEVLIRQVESPMSLPIGFSGCTILGDGRLIPLVDLANLLNWATASSESQTPTLSLAARIYQQPIPANCILVIDDSVNVRRFLAMTLERAGYRVEQAQDGQDAIEQLQNGLQVQAIICDIEMPRMDGFGVLATLKNHPQFQSIPITMLTSRSGPKHQKLAKQLGADAYFFKPFEENTVLQTLQQLIQRAATLPIG